jgi:hypothetical protein
VDHPGLVAGGCLGLAPGARDHPPCTHLMSSERSGPDHGCLFETRGRWSALHRGWCVRDRVVGRSWQCAEALYSSGKRIPFGRRVRGALPVVVARRAVHMPAGTAFTDEASCKAGGERRVRAATTL